MDDSLRFKASVYSCDINGEVGIVSLTLLHQLAGSRRPRDAQR